MKTIFEKIRSFTKTNKKTTYAILLVLIIGGYYGYKKMTDTSGETRYVMAEATKGTLISSVTGSGQVSATNEVEIKPKVSGDQYVTTINVQAIDSASMAEAQQQITDLLLTRHHISDSTLADFNTMNMADLVSTVSSVTGTFTTLLAAIAGISLIVGGIGIMNMMLTTVTERTKEIGLRKSVGAKKRDISLQFLAEAVMLTFLGGVIGVALGWLVSFGISYSGILQTSISLSSVLIAFGVSAGIGIVSGYYPAKRAASLNPIDALRYE